MPDNQRYYTGDTINPLVLVRYSNGGWPEDMNVTLTVTRPDASVGNALERRRPEAARARRWRRHSRPGRRRCKSIEASTGNPVAKYVDTTIALSDEPGINGSVRIRRCSSADRCPIC